MKPTEDPRLLKLPQWVQQRIRNAEDAVEYLRSENEHLRGVQTVEKPMIFSDPYMARIPIGDVNESIEFAIHNARVKGKKVRVSYDRHETTGTTLLINADNRVRVLPQSANTFLLQVDD